MKLIKTFTLFLLIFTITGCRDIPIQTQGTGTLSGTVQTSGTGTPIAEVMITTSPGSSTTMTDSNGEFSINNISAGNYIVYAFKESYNLSKINIAIFEDDENPVSILLNSESSSLGSIAGNIYDQNGQALPFANVSTIPGTLAAISDGSGAFILPDIPAGEYTLVAGKPGYVSANIPLSVKENASTPGNLVISKDSGTNTNPVETVFTAPADGAVNQITSSLLLQWSCSDPDGDTLTYDVYFWKEGTDSARLISETASTAYTFSSDLDNNSKYFWMVLAKDSSGGFSISPIWSFTTIP